jgi:hypothetical protein
MLSSINYSLIHAISIVWIVTFVAVQNCQSCCVLFNHALLLGFCLYESQHLRIYTNMTCLLLSISFAVITFKACNTAASFTAVRHYIAGIRHALNVCGGRQRLHLHFRILGGASIVM